MDLIEATKSRFITAWHTLLLFVRGKIFSSRPLRSSPQSSQSFIYFDLILEEGESDQTNHWILREALDVFLFFPYSKEKEKDYFSVSLCSL